jgi:peptide/nickel transport system substrate-binding protein
MATVARVRHALVMRTSRRQLLRGTVMAAGGVMSAAWQAACGGGAAPAGQAPAEVGRSATQAPAEQPEAGGTLNLVVANNPPTLDPHGTSAAFTHQLLTLVMSRLLKFKAALDPAVGENREVEGDLALSVESPDAATWIVKLRPEARFHPVPPVSGHAVTAEDVRATFARAVAPTAVNRAVFDMIDPAAIDTPARDTVVFRLKYPYAPFPRTLASGYAWILPREAVAGDYDVAKQVIGSGPFVFESYTPDVAFVGRRNPDWYERGRPYLDAVRIAIIPDKAQQLAQFTAGNIDYVGVDIEDLDTMRRSNPQADVISIRHIDNFYIYFQLREMSSPFHDIRVRRAMSLAIDRQALGRVVLGPRYWLNPVVGLGFGKWAVQMEDLPAATTQWYRFDVAQGRRLLEEAGVSGLTIKFNETKPQPRGARYYTIAETVANMLGALPWKVMLVVIDYNKDWVGGGRGARYGYFPADTVGLTGLEAATDVDEYLYGHFHSRSGKNIIGLRDRQVDAWIERARELVQEEERVKVYREVQAYLADKLYCLSGFPDWYTYTMLQPRVRNWTVPPIGSYGHGTETYAGVWIKK